MVGGWASGAAATSRPTGRCRAALLLVSGVRSFRSRTLAPVRNTALRPSALASSVGRVDPVGLCSPEYEEAVIVPSADRGHHESQHASEDLEGEAAEGGQRNNPKEHDGQPQDGASPIPGNEDRVVDVGSPMDLIAGCSPSTGTSQDAPRVPVGPVGDPAPRQVRDNHLGMLPGRCEALATSFHARAPIAIITGCPRR